MASKPIHRINTPMHKQQGKLVYEKFIPRSWLIKNKKKNYQQKNDIIKR